MKTSHFKRIMIFGRPGSGKTTFATWLSKFLNIPLHHLDKYFYVNNWIERDYDEFLKLQQNIIDTDCWIIDGNSTRSLDMRFSTADLAIYFNFPKFICTYRIFKRFFKRSKLSNDRAQGCNEVIRWSLLKYMWDFEKRVDQKIKDLQKLYPNVIFKEIKSNDDLNELKKYL